MNKNYYKSQVDIYNLLIIVLCYLVIIAYPLWLYANTINGKIGVIVISLFLIYLYYCYSITVFYFYEDRTEIRYIFRLKNRIKIIEYTIINEVHYINGGGRINPSVVLVYAGKKFKRTYFASNSFTHKKFEKRKEILLFLYNKGLPIIVNTVFNKDIEIIQETKANGEWYGYEVKNGIIKK